MLSIISITKKRNYNQIASWSVSLCIGLPIIIFFQGTKYKTPAAPGILVLRTCGNLSV